MILCDTSALIAFLDKSDKHHLAVRQYRQERLLVWNFSSYCHDSKHISSLAKSHVKLSAT
jgi:predicted nucleic acid-binding protein